MGILHLDHVNKHYAGGDVWALRDVSLQLDPGSFVAVQGPSGCGKTTLLLVCGGLLRPDSGSVRVAQQPLSDLSAEERARFRASRIGFIFQQFHLIPYLTVLENVALPLAKAENLDGNARPLDLLRKFKLENRADRLPAALSTGERQRVAVARAMVNRPGLLLADEPTGNLDEDNAELVLKALESFSDEGGASLLVTHDRSAAGRAHRVAHMEDGRLRWTS